VLGIDLLHLLVTKVGAAFHLIAITMDYSQRMAEPNPDAFLGTSNVDIRRFEKVLPGVDISTLPLRSSRAGWYIPVEHSYILCLFRE
jgi:hypothetical protein